MTNLIHTISFLAVVMSVFILLYSSSIIKERISGPAGKGIRLFAGIWIFSFLPMLLASVGPSTVTAAGFSLLIRGTSYLVLLYAFIQIGTEIEGKQGNTLMGLAILWFVSLILPRGIHLLPHSLYKQLNPIIFYIEYACRLLSSFGLLGVALISSKVASAKGESFRKSPNKAL